MSREVVSTKDFLWIDGDSATWPISFHSSGQLRIYRDGLTILGVWIEVESDIHFYMDRNSIHEDLRMNFDPMCVKEIKKWLAERELLGN